MWLQVISMAQTGQEISSDMLKNAGRFFNLYNIVNLESMPILEAYRSEVSISNLPSAPSLWGTFVGDDGRFFLRIIAVVMF
jgi:hypothetical protein